MRIHPCFAALTMTFAIGCTADPTAPVKHAFMTSDVFVGDLVTAAGDPSLDGIAAADLLCNRAAANAHRGGTWTAWISVGDGANLGYHPTDPNYLVVYPHASYRSAAIDRIVGDGPWFNLGTDLAGSPPTEARMFADRTALVTDRGPGDLWYTEYAVPPDSSVGVQTWTGTRDDGQPTSWDCTGWTSTTADLTSAGLTPDSPNLGVAGAESDYSDNVEIGPVWTDDAQLSCYDQQNPRCPDLPVPANRDAAGWGTASCKERAHLYCFEN